MDYKVFCLLCLNGNPFFGLQKGKVNFLTTLVKNPTAGRSLLEKKEKRIGRPVILRGRLQSREGANPVRRGGKSFRAHHYFFAPSRLCLCREILVD